VAAFLNGEFKPTNLENLQNFSALSAAVQGGQGVAAYEVWG